MVSDSPFIIFDKDCRTRLLDSLPFEKYVDKGFLNYPVATPILRMLYEDGVEYNVEHSNVNTLIISAQVEHLKLGKFIAACIFSAESKDTSIGYPKRIRNTFTLSEREEFENGFLNSCDTVRRHFDCLQYAITHPKRIFREGKNGKRVLNKAPRHGDDEPLYQRIKALRSIIQETHSTGKGTPHRHEYDVRGHYRHYKNGKVVFIKPHTCCVGRGAKNFHEYEVRS